MMVHILNGDALADTFKKSGIHGEVIICREGLIDGPVASDDPAEFWSGRARYFQQDFEGPPNEYQRVVKAEFDKLSGLDPDQDIFLWFEHDLFCQTNMWFIISLLNKNDLTKIYRVSPLPKLNTQWQGFGRHAEDDLKSCLGNRVSFFEGDLKLGANLWDAFRKSNLESLRFLSGSVSPCFPRLEEICNAEIDRKKYARPVKALKEIIAKGYTEFSDIFAQFSQREAIYGFGNVQVDTMLKELRR
jgi:hypothetical protein